MGLNLKRTRFAEWLEPYGPDSRAEYLAKLEKHVGQEINVNAWTVEDSDYPRVGSYTAYGVFRLCLQYLVKGAFENSLEDDADVELAALKAFRKKLRPKSLRIPYVTHFLESGDTDTIFIPILFKRPFEYDERFVASLPGGLRALQAFANGLGFDLNADYDDEDSEKTGKWLPVGTAKNVARILYTFFDEEPNACVALC